MRKKTLLPLICLILVLALSSTAGAHSGGTDSQGGHRNRSTGEYHYHHGYPAHQHTGGECPYDYDDRTGENSGSSSKKTTEKTSTNSPEKSSKLTGEDIAGLCFYLGGFVILGLVIFKN